MTTPYQGLPTPKVATLPVSHPILPVPSEDDTLPVSIPIEMEIEVTVMYVDEDDLYQTTKMFLNNFDLSRIKDMKEATKSGQTMARQNSKICKRVRQGYEYRGMDFTMSDKVYRGQEGQWVWSYTSCWELVWYKERSLFSSLRILGSMLSTYNGR